MRTPRSLSYSSMTLWEKNPEEFYLRYLADHAAPRLPQEPPMAVGSSFDARVKSNLHTDLFGAGSDPRFAFETVFESQVEPQCRDFALPAGQVVFDAYKLSGAYDELLALLQQAVEPPRFEFKVDGVIAGAPFTGKPDCRFVLDRGFGRIHCILDWKVHGYCSKYPTSPSKGYMLCRDGYKSAKQSRSHGTQHTNFLAYDHLGLTINAGYMEFCNDEYADQLCLYGWLLGEKPGDENVVAMIEEVVAKPAEPTPILRIANHRARIKADYQQKLLDRVVRCWQAITTGNVFDDLTPEENAGRRKVLEDMALSLGKTAGEYDDWFNEATRPQFKH
jgi:hypothetical protein